ncbi:MAG: phosphoribosylglycinamide formyltransferase [Nitrospinota bacterium]|nr:phosphoribosylglycinamide formyltransferase [Nitrospinota bacterium]
MTSSNYKIGVLVSGRGTNLQAIIDAIENGELKARIAVVISDKQDAPALERSRKHGIEAVWMNPKQFASKKEYDLALALELKNRQIDLVCLAGYMRILSPEFIGIFSGKIINIHPSLLPAFPGLNVQQKAIDYGVKFSGCTVHFVNEEVDGGAIILQAVVPVHDSDDAQTLADRILVQEHLIYPKAIQMIIENRLHIENRKVTLKESIPS